MSKYIDADKLIKLVKEWRSKQMGFAWVAVNDVLQIITSLQQEQMELGLDREIIKYKVPFTDESEYLNETTLDAIARHFYELGLNARKEDEK